MFRTIAATVLLVALQLAPAHACMRFASPGAIDLVLGESAAALTPVQIETVKALRDQVADLLAKRDHAGARSAENRAMDIMGRTYETKGPPTRGCQSGEWVRKTS